MEKEAETNKRSDRVWEGEKAKTNNSVYSSQGNRVREGNSNSQESMLQSPARIIRK